MCKKDLNKEMIYFKDNIPSYFEKFYKLYKENIKLRNSNFDVNKLTKLLKDFVVSSKYDEFYNMLKEKFIGTMNKYT